MTTIYKYPLQLGRTVLELPSGAQVLTVQMQRAFSEQNGLQILGLTL